MDDVAKVRAPAVEMLVSALLGLVAALVLSIDAVKLAANPDVVLSCDISAAISCGKVGLSAQASLFGFPNSFLGLIAEPVVITVAVALLGGVRFPRWFMVAAQAVYTFGLVFAFWLFYEAYFHIGALCPWCLTITATTTLVWFSLLRINLSSGVFGDRARAATAPALRVGADTAAALLVLAAVAAMVLAKYV